LKKILLVAAGTLAVYALIYIDVTMRAKESFLKGEKYMLWYREPAQKAAYYDNLYTVEKAVLDKRFEQKKLKEEDYKARVESLEFEKSVNLNESPLKYAYQWYKDTYELFSPPESKWVKQARQKAPAVLALWKDELRAKKIPFEDYMFE